MVLKATIGFNLTFNVEEQFPLFLLLVLLVAYAGLFGLASCFALGKPCFFLFSTPALVVFPKRFTYFLNDVNHH